MICSKCSKEFNSTKENIDGLCSKCRYVVNIDKYRKTNFCACGKRILKTSTVCKSCSQIGELNHQYKTGYTTERRYCSCGNLISLGSSKLCFECRNRSLVGSGNPNYRSGTFSNIIYSKEEYKKWRNTVRKRDSFTCKLCGSSKRGVMDAHHIYSKAEFPTLVFEEVNGITLCKQCHRKTYGKENDYVEIFLNIIDDQAVLKLRELLERPEAGNQQPSKLEII